MIATKAQKQLASKVVRHLARDYPDVSCALVHTSPLQLLIATILSAQCTDERVNMVTPELFRKYPTAADLATAELGELEQVIQSTGFFRNKAKNIKGCCQQLVADHGGEVPQTLDALVALPGVGRKTANVVLGTAFGIPSGVVVDTHVSRISQRLGLTNTKDAVKAEAQLMDQLPRSQWIDYSHRMIHHGRAICQARSPKCELCSMKGFCPRVGVASKQK
jgi:endonuclease-3